MPADSRLFEDLSRVATGAFSALNGVREEFEGRVREQLEKLLARLDLVTREEFDAVQAMAANARSEQTALESRIAALESRLAALSDAAESASDEAGTAAAARKRRGAKPPDA